MKPALAVFAAILLTILFLTTTANSTPEQFQARITRIVDGDTIEVSTTKNQNLTVRLAQIDAPESTQPYGTQSTAELSKLALGHDATITVVDIDRYGRTVGEVYLDDLENLGQLHLNTEMVRQGHAWAFTRYVTTLSIIDIEADARANNRGLWKLPPTERDAPWVWREQARARKTRPDETIAFVKACNPKRTCAEMVSCKEARFHFTECSTPGLDKDRDGVPCESLCSK